MYYYNLSPIIFLSFVICYMSGFGITLTAETTKEVFFSGQAFSPLMTTGSLPCVPEDLGKEAAMKLLDEIYR